jgi:hypothetical protein
MAKAAKPFIHIQENSHVSVIGCQAARKDGGHSPK